jgi:hypothetical protein
VLDAGGSALQCEAADLGYVDEEEGSGQGPPDVLAEDLTFVVMSPNWEVRTITTVFEQNFNLQRSAYSIKN